MSDRRKPRPKDQSRDQTVFQLQSRQSRNYLSAKMVSLIRANDQSHEFTAQELIQIESLLRDEFQTNQWLLNVCKAIGDESVVVTKEELDLYNKSQTEGQDVCITQSKVEELQKELDFLRERVHVLTYILKNLTEKLSEVRKNGLNDKKNRIETNSTEVWINFRIKLKELLESMKTDLTTDMILEEPKDIAERIITELNDKSVSVNSSESPNEWLSRQLDELALSDTNQRQTLEAFNHEIGLKLEDLDSNLVNLQKEFLRIKHFYDVNVREEMCWRSDLNTCLAHFGCLNGPEVIRLKSIKSKDKGLTEKRQLIEEYSQLFAKVEKQEFDEFRALVEALKQRIEILSDSNHSMVSSN